MSRLTRLISDRFGNVAVEFALILPVSVAMLAGLIEYGLAANVRTALENGARAGAQLALFQGFDLNGIKNAVTAATDVTLTSQDVNASEFYECDGAWGTAVAAGTACAGGATLAKFVTVTATKAYSPYFPLIDFILPSQLQGSATVRVP